jgi:uncharacterized phage protein (TIGR01671 family)
MREIKFRAWDGKNMFDVGQITFNDGVWTLSEGRGISIKYQPHITLMQFTGLKDKNGNEIYEGDILGRTTDNNFVFVVDFLNGEFSGVTEPGRNYRLRLREAMTLERSPYVQIIGNIYENHELLNQQTQTP